MTYAKAKENNASKKNQPKEYTPTFFCPPVGIAGIASAFVLYRETTTQQAKATENKNIELKQF